MTVTAYTTFPHMNDLLSFWSTVQYICKLMRVTFDSTMLKHRSNVNTTHVFESVLI